MKYAKIINNVVDHIIFEKKDGYIQVPDNVFGGMIQTVDGFAAAKKDLETARNDKKDEITDAFNIESINTLEVNGIIYNGGFDSAIKLDAAKRLNETAGLTEVTFYDIDNKPNSLSIGGATVVIMTIANKFQTDLAKYQDLKVQLAGKKLVSTIEALSW